MRRRYTKEQRTQLVDWVTGGGVTVSEAAAKLAVTRSAAYSWMAEARRLGKTSTPRAIAGPMFARLVPSAVAEATIAVRVGGAEIQIRHGFDGELLRAVVATLAEGTR